VPKSEFRQCGQTFTVGMDSNGFIDEITTPAETTWTFTHDSAGNLTSITTPAAPMR
jgi:YD repeat-containing protein